MPDWTVIEGFNTANRRGPTVSVEVARELGAAFARADGKWISNGERLDSRQHARNAGEKLRRALFSHRVLREDCHVVNIGTKAEDDGQFTYLLRLVVKQQAPAQRTTTDRGGRHG